MNDPNDDRMTQIRQELAGLLSSLHEQEASGESASMVDLHELEGLRTAVRVLERHAQRLEAEREASAFGALTIDAQDRVVGWNKRFLELWQVKPPVPPPTGSSLLAELDGRCERPGTLLNLLSGVDPSSRLTSAVPLADGRILEVQTSPIDTDPPARFFQFTDVTESARLEARQKVAEDRYRSLVDFAPGAVFQIRRDRRWHIESVSPMIATLCGYTPSYFVSHRLERWTDLILRQDLREFGLAIRHALRSGRPFNVEFRIRHADGSVRRLSMRGWTIRETNGPVVGIDGIVSDVTSRREDQTHLREANAQLRERLEDLDARTHQLELLNTLARDLQSAKNLPELIRGFVQAISHLVPESIGAVYTVDRSTTIAKAARTWPRKSLERPLRGMPVRDCLALCLGHTHRPGQTHEEACRLCRNATPTGHLCLPIGRPPEVDGFVYLRPMAGVAFDNHLWALAIAACEQFALAFSNLRLRDVLHEEAIRDPLTGLFNRRYLDDMLRKDFEKAAKAGEQMSVLMIDLDHFKAFNDRYGHEAGDNLLRTVGRHIGQHIRSDDAACRYGGEEFTILLRKADLSVGIARAETLREGIGTLHAAHHRQVLGPITASIGVAAFPDNGKHWNSVLRAADVALFRAKQMGRDRVIAAR